NEIACSVERRCDAATLADVILDLAIGSERSTAIIADRHVERGPWIRCLGRLGVVVIALVDPGDVDLPIASDGEGIKAMTGLGWVVVESARGVERSPAVD